MISSSSAAGCACEGLCSAADAGAALDVNGGRSAPVVSGLALLMLLPAAGEALSTASDDAGRISLEHILTLWRTRAPPAPPDAPPPPPAHEILRGVLHCDLFSAARVSGTTARVSLHHPRANEVFALAAPAARRLLEARVDVAPLVPVRGLAPHVLTAFALTEAASWDPCAAAAAPEALMGALLPPRTAPPHARNAAALGALATLAQLFASPVTPRGAAAPPSAPPAAAVGTMLPHPEWAATRTTTVISSVPELITFVARFSRAQLSPLVPMAVHVAHGADASPAFISLTTVSESVVVDIDAMTAAAAAARSLRFGASESDEPVPLLAVVFPLLPIFLHPCIIKVFFDTGATLGALAIAGFHAVNVYSTAIAMEELAAGAAGSASRRVPADEGGLVAALGSHASTESAASTAAHTGEVLLRAAFAACDLLCGVSRSGSEDLVRRVRALVGLTSASATPPFALERATLRSQLSALVRHQPTSGNTSAATAGVKRPRSQDLPPPQCVPSWWLVCNSCHKAAGHFVFDCQLNARL
jgi:hypothetical protein